jgi:IclR family KDG regulon transcriptional repressor
MSRNVQSLERGLVVLESIVKNGATGVTELAEHLELDKTVVHRLLRTLYEMGYVTQDEHRRYTVGAKLRAIGAKTLIGLDLRALAIPYMRALAEHTKGVSHLAKMAESRVIYIERVHHPELAATSTDVGGEAHGYCSAAGKILWAYLPEVQLNQLLDRVELRQHTLNTITDRMALQQYLAQVRDQGYALDREEHRLGLVGLGAPIRDHTGAIIASICVAENAMRSTPESLQITLNKVLESAQKLSIEMGYSNG